MRRHRVFVSEGPKLKSMVKERETVTVYVEKDRDKILKYLDKPEKLYEEGKISEKTYLKLKEEYLKKLNKTSD